MSDHSVILRPVDCKDYQFLFTIRNNFDDLHLWSIRRHPLYSIEQFSIEFENDLQTDKHVFLVIEYKKEPVGFVFSYSPQFVDGNCFVTIYLLPETRLRGLGPFALGKFLLYLFDTFNFYKVYCDVYSYNKASFSTLKTFGAEVEGCFREHRFWNGQRNDMIRFAIYASSKESINQIVNRISKRFAITE